MFTGSFFLCNAYATDFLKAYSDALVNVNFVGFILSNQKSAYKVLFKIKITVYPVLLIQLSTTHTYIITRQSR